MAAKLDSHAVASDMIDFLNASPTAFHAVDEAKRRLRSAGYHQLSEREPWKLQPGNKYFFTRNHSTIVAFAIGKKYVSGNGFHIIGAHTDSPCLKLKPVTKVVKAGILEVGVQTYGGGLWHTWFDRDLTVAGRVIVQEENAGSVSYSHRLVRIEEPIMRIPTLAIHLDKTVSDGFKFNNETHLIPILATSLKGELNKVSTENGPVESGNQNDGKKANDKTGTSNTKHHLLLLQLLASKLGCEPDDICDFELQACDTQPSTIAGAAKEFIFSGRLDNLCMSFCSLKALIDATSSDSSLPKLLFLIVILSLSASVGARPFVLILSQEDYKDDPPADPDSPAEWDEFAHGDAHKSEEDLDPGSWRPIFEPPAGDPQPLPESDAAYYSAVHKLMSGEPALIQDAGEEIAGLAVSGHPAAQSVLGFLWEMGLFRERSKGKAFLYHHFAAEGGNMQSKMALAYSYTRQDMLEKGVKLYGELAEVAVNSFLISKESPVIEAVRLHNGAEENKEALGKSKGEEDEDFQILEYQAQKGNAAAMYKVGLFYYFGLRGLRRDHSKALWWFLKAVEKGEPRSMELLGEIYARGAGVERNYTKALEWLTLASRHHLYSAYNGMGYLYVKGYGVDQKNYTKAKEYFEKAADNDEVGGHYNLGVMYLKGIGVKRDVKLACKFFVLAANHGQPKAFYQLAKIFHTGLGFKKNIPLATALYKLVAERGPWSSLSRWALESYLKGDIGKAFMLYSRMAEMGYEVAQSNAAWILDKYGERSMCMGESGFCTDAERHQRAHSLWWQASEQGNEHAALLIGDAYYYGRGTARDYERAAEAYMHAKSQSNAQAMFNLGYMHEHGQGLPFDLHLAKRYYDEALDHDPAAKLPVTLALSSLWVRKNYADSFVVQVIDSLPELYPKLEAWVENVLLEEGNATILTLFVCLLTVLYLRERQRRQAAVAAGEVAQPNHPNELGVPAAPI